MAAVGIQLTSRHALEGLAALQPRTAWAAACPAGSPRPLCCHTALPTPSLHSVTLSAFTFLSVMLWVAVLPIFC